MIYETIQAHQENGSQLGLQPACQTLGISRAAFMNWQDHKSPDRKACEPEVLEAIQDIAGDFTRYGYRRITKQLQRDGLKVNHKKVLRITRQNGLLCKRKKPFKPSTTQSNHGLRTYPNLIKNIQVVKLNQVWVADITYIALGHGFVYLAAILDIYSRKCIGWQLSFDINAQLCLDALNMAIKDRKGISLKDVIHHSDQGVQYASHDYVKQLEENGLRVSMSRKACPTDNAFAESFMKTFKYEEVYLTEYASFKDAYKNVKQFIEDVYNKKRLHSSIGYKPPNEFEREVLKNIVA